MKVFEMSEISKAISEHAQKPPTGFAMSKYCLMHRERFLTIVGLKSEVLNPTIFNNFIKNIQMKKTIDKIKK